MRFSFALISALFVAAQAAAAKTEPKSLQIGIKARNPDSNCVKTKDGDSLSMHYTGSLWSTGAVFDSSVSRGPFDFVLGQGQVIKGWDLGLRGMCIGEKRKLSFPASLGYGDRGAGASIPPNSALVFEVELLAINGNNGKDEL
ncbi:FK506-binding protein 2A [Podila epicladia]|nr:FK506-binding protein 2A [Podila epicladia]KAG0098280.1 FK506-binding protein 2A [Podila epicladia]